jgi:hypothetical protein
MANEVMLQALLRCAKGGAVSGISFGPATFTMSGNAVQEGVQVVGTTEEALILGDVTSPGWLFLRNLDPTNFVTMRAIVTGTPFLRLPPSGIAGPIYLVAAAPTLQADTAPCLVEYLLLSA